jgi:hypothetical protein
MVEPDGLALANPDGTVSFITIVPGFNGLEFVAGTGAGKRTLTLRDAQHEYVLSRKVAAVAAASASAALSPGARPSSSAGDRRIAQLQPLQRRLQTPARSSDCCASESAGTIGHKAAQARAGRAAIAGCA